MDYISNSGAAQIYNYEHEILLVIPRKMIIRESPTPSKSPSKAAWPPRSPREALQLSPSRHKRRQDVDRDILHSPVKRRRLGTAGHVDIVSDEDEDEETLQLQLREIQARLKLKKLQKAKQQSLLSGSSSSRKDVIDTTIEVQVPHSPKATRPVEKQPESPRRVQLGIDKGLRAEHVSLKKARTSSEALRRATDASVSGSRAKSKTFSEKLLDARTQDQKREERRDRLDNARFRGFRVASTSSRSAEEAGKGSEGRRKTPNIGAAQSTACQLALPSSFRQPGSAPGDQPVSGSNPKLDKAAQRLEKGFTLEDSAIATDDYDPFSQFDLSQRHIDNQTLTVALADKTVIRIPNLLRQVTAPNYDPPDCEDDYVVIGIIASKSTPRNHAAKELSTDPKGDADSLPQRSKFMVLKLTDLKWELDLFLFGTAFDQFWKLTEGTVIALLNPAIMPPKPHMRDTGRFSLKLASSEDTVLEIGVSRDLGWCKSIKRDGKECGQWVNKEKTEFCDFHVSLGIDRARAGRMEINGMVGVGLFGNSVKNERRGKGGGGGRGGKWNGKSKGDGLLKEGPQYDRHTGETSWIVPKAYGSGGNTARLLDAEDYVHGGMSKAERSQKRFAAKEKERELAKALGSSGSGLGGEYMRTKRGDARSEDTEEEHEVEKPKDAAALGLVGSGAADVTLSPVKRRSNGNAAKTPMGWGGAYKPGLPSLSKTPTSESKDVEPSKSKGEENETSRKRARFMLEQKGVRIPGRVRLAHPPADEDDLDIV